MTPQQRQDWWNTSNKFKRSREKTWAPKVNSALQNQYDAASNYLKEHGIDALKRNLIAVIPTAEISKVIKNIYIDAGTVFGGKAYQMVKKQAKKQTKALMPIGYNEDLVNEIIQYFQTDLLSAAVLPITNTTHDLILKILSDAEQNGVSINDIVDQLKSSDLSTARARLIARTETNKASSYGALQSVKKLGYNTLKIWISAGDLRTRRIPRDAADHLHANGMKVPMDEPFKIPDLLTGGFVYMMQPGDPAGGVENCANCRCTLGFEVVD